MVANMTITPVTGDMLAAQIERENEQEAVHGGQEDQIEAGAEGTSDGDQGSNQEGDGERQPREKPVQMSPLDQKRLDMANRFKRPGLEAMPFDGDLTRPENIYGSVAAEELEVDPDAPEPGVPAARQEQQQDQQRQPRMITQKVRGKDVTLSEDEWLERARKVEAADSYMEEGRVLLEIAKGIRAERAGQDHQPHDGQTSTEDRQDDDDHSRSARPNAPDLKSVVEKIQFGDPEEAARELGDIIARTAHTQANEGHVARLVSNDLARSKADLAKFRADHPEFANDTIAENAIENMVYQIYRDEIKALGIDEAQIPQDPKALADWHRLYRVHGHTVSKPLDVLNQAKSKFDAWRGVSQQPAKPANERKEKPRVAVNVDRTERRMAIPVQPSRAVAPRRDAAPVVQENSRKSAVQEMRKARGQPVV